MGNRIDEKTLSYGSLFSQRCFRGGLIGILLGCGITVILSKCAHWAVSVSLSSILLSSIFSASIGVIFGLWPARKASLLNPIEALRYD